MLCALAYGASIYLQDPGIRPERLYRAAERRAQRHLRAASIGSLCVPGIHARYLSPGNSGRWFVQSGIRASVPFARYSRLAVNRLAAKPCTSSSDRSAVINRYVNMILDSINDGGGARLYAIDSVSRLSYCEHVQPPVKHPDSIPWHVRLPLPAWAILHWLVPNCPS